VLHSDVGTQGSRQRHDGSTVHENQVGSLVEVTEEVVSLQQHKTVHVVVRDEHLPALPDALGDLAYQVGNGHTVDPRVQKFKTLRRGAD